MPYSSDAQRKFFHTDTAKKAGITGDEVKEFDKASKGKELPEHVKKMADGGFPQEDKDAPGLQDASASDFLLPYLLGPTSKLGALGEAAPAAEEAMAARVGGKAAPMASDQMAPVMGDAMKGASPHDIPLDLKPILKGVQKGAKGSTPVKLWGVEGAPEDVAKLGYGPNPASVPENVLQNKGILPTQTSVPTQNSPTNYAKGGFPHVTFLENESPAQVQKDVHMKKHTLDSFMAEGGLAKPALPEDEATEAAPATPPVAPAAVVTPPAPPTAPTTAPVSPAAPKPAAATAPSEPTGMSPEKKPIRMAKGGVVPGEMSHENKLNSIYKAMGIKKYADGGTPDPTAPPAVPGLPPQTDPGFVQALLAAIKSGGSSALSSIMPGTQSLGNAVAAPAAAAAQSPVIPAAMNAMGGNLPMPAQASTPPAPAPVPVAPPAPPSPVAMHSTPGTAPAAAPPSGMPNLSTMFNQDTSKLTEGVNPEDRQALANKLQAQQHGLGAIIAQAVAGLGDAYSAKGGKETHALGNIFGMQTQQRQEALANFDKARQDRVQKLQLQTQMGENALKQAAAADAYGVDDHLNGMLNAPKGTMKKDLPTYMGIMSAGIAAKEKDEDLYMKSHAQAGLDVDNAVKNAGMLNMKPSPAQLQASGQKLADSYYNKAKGNIGIKATDGSQHWIPASSLGKAKQMDPGVQVMQ
jgi:hypothetical protein